MEFSSSAGDSGTHFAGETNNNYGNCHFGRICTEKLHCINIRQDNRETFKPLFLHLQNIFSGKFNN